MTDDLTALLARIHAEHAPRVRPKWRSGLEARLAERDDDAAAFPDELLAVERGDFLRHYTVKEICDYTRRMIAETQEASARARALVDRHNGRQT